MSLARPWERLVETLMLERRETRLLLFSVTADSFGTGIFTATSVLFFTQVRGFDVTAVGIAISIGSLCALAAGPVIGAIADRFGAQRSLIVLFLVRAVGYGLFLLATEYWMFLVLMCLVTVADRSSPAINQAVMGQIFSARERATILGTVFSARNAAIVLGALAATLPVVTGDDVWYLAGIGVNAATFVAAAFLMSRLEVPAGAPAPTLGDPVAPATRNRPVRDPRYVLITVVNAVAMTHNTILALVLPLWVVTGTDAPAWGLTMLLAINGALASLCQIAVNRRFASFRAATVAPVWGGLAVFLACAVYAASGHISTPGLALLVLVAAMLAHTAGECLFIASTPLSFELAPRASLGRYLSFYNLGRVGQDLVGPTLVVSPLLHRGTPAWLLVGAVVLVAGLLPWLTLRNHQPVPEPAPEGERAPA